MNNKNLENYLLNLLYSLEGKINKADFKEIAKFYKWNFNFKSIHIVGTNGKGSNAKYICDELILNGFDVGLFTSPHVVSMYERIKINNSNIDFETMAQYVSQLKVDFPNINFGWFDIFFLTSIMYFHKKEIDVAVFEAGIGAKKDIVNYINHDYLLITSISFDHENILGNSLYKIAQDKSFAIKKNVEVFVPSIIEKQLIDVFKERAKKEKAKINIVKISKKNDFRERNEQLSKFFLEKAFQIYNFKNLFYLPIGRVQKVLINNFVCYLDVAHNLESVKEVLKYFKKKEINFQQIVVSLSSDKDVNNILTTIENTNQNIFIYQNKGRKPLNIWEYPKKYKYLYDLDNFLKKLNGSTLFLGSFYLIGEIFDILKLNGDINVE